MNKLENKTIYKYLNIIECIIICVIFVYLYMVINSISIVRINKCDEQIAYGETIIWRARYFDCRNLNEVIIPDSVKKIESEAFADCSNLKKIVIPSSVWYIGPLAFGGNRNLEEVIIEEGIGAQDGLLEIGNAAFYGCANLKKINIPKSVKKIGKEAFENSSLKEIHLPKGVDLGENVFEGCSPNLKIEYY